MTKGKSAQKQMRVAEGKRLRNRSVRSQVKTRVTKAEKLIASGEGELAKEAVTAAVTALDRASEKGILHPNNSARRKSRLVRKLNKALSVPETTPEDTE